MMSMRPSSTAKKPHILRKWSHFFSIRSKRHLPLVALIKGEWPGSLDLIEHIEMERNQRGEIQLSIRLRKVSQSEIG
jgi:hypothetical protein